MIEMTNLLTLRELSSEYPIVLMDNSILYGRLSANEEKTGSKEKRALSIAEQQRFFEVLRYYIGEGIPFFITASVFEESFGGHYPYKKLIKMKGLQKNRASLDLARKVLDLRKQGKRIINLLEEKGRIIELNETEKDLYNSLCNTHYGNACAELGSVDSDLLIKGAVFSKTRGATCIASNDFPMFHLWKDFVNSKRINKEQFGFAVRLGANSFKLLDNNHR
jgi:hypothetical protein